MTYRLTRESARAAGACYSDKRLAELIPPEGLTLDDVAARSEDTGRAAFTDKSLPQPLVVVSAESGTVVHCRRVDDHVGMSCTCERPDGGRAP